MNEMMVNDDECEVNIVMNEPRLIAKIYRGKEKFRDKRTQGRQPHRFSPVVGHFDFRDLLVKDIEKDNSFLYPFMMPKYNKACLLLFVSAWMALCAFDCVINAAIVDSSTTSKDESATCADEVLSASTRLQKTSKSRSGRLPTTTFKGKMKAMKRTFAKGILDYQRSRLSDYEKAVLAFTEKNIRSQYPRHPQHFARSQQQHRHKIQTVVDTAHNTDSKDDSISSPSPSPQGTKDMARPAADEKSNHNESPVVFDGTPGKHDKAQSEPSRKVQQRRFQYFTFSDEHIRVQIRDMVKNEVKPRLEWFDVVLLKFSSRFNRTSDVEVKQILADFKQRLKEEYFELDLHGDMTVSEVNGRLMVIVEALKDLQSELKLKITSMRRRAR